MVCLTADLKKDEPESYAYLKEKLGDKFYYNPMTANPDELSKQDFKEMLDVMQSGNFCVFCNHGADRTGYFVAMMRKVLFGRSTQQCMEEVYAYNRKVHPSQASRYPLA